MGALKKLIETITILIKGFKMEITQHKVIKINIRKKSYKTKKHNFKIITYVFLTEDGQTTTFNMHVGKKYPTITTNKIEYITS